MNLAQSYSFSPSRQWIALAVGVVSAVAIYIGHGRSFVSLSYDPHAINCLPELHLALLVHRRPTKVERGDYLFWKASSIGALSYVAERFVLKKVAGVPGDRLSIQGDRILINGRLVAEGLEDAVLYKRPAAAFQRTEVIPPGKYFVIGTARLSNDSRYWGYLAHETIVGKGYRIY
jgi:conjugal transfer pilin signal peptidase TrbI